MAPEARALGHGRIRLLAGLLVSREATVSLGVTELGMGAGLLAGRLLACGGRSGPPRWIRGRAGRFRRWRGAAGAAPSGAAAAVDGEAHPGAGGPAPRPRPRSARTRAAAAGERGFMEATRRPSKVPMSGPARAVPLHQRAGPAAEEFLGRGVDQHRRVRVGCPGHPG